MKKNVMMRVASALLVAVLMTTCAISGTFAKYTTTAEGSDSARVAKWDVKLNGATVANTTFTFDLFKTINDTTLGGGLEQDIKPTDGTIIAPGTQGSFEILLKNDSEVTAEYLIDFSVINDADIPVKFSLDGTTWVDNIDNIDVTTAVRLEMGAAATSVTVYWIWDFEGDNAFDTELGLDGDATIKVTAKITATQVN